MFARNSAGSIFPTAAIEQSTRLLKWIDSLPPLPE